MIDTSLKHTFAICAYKESPYLEACIRSLKAQTLPTEIILCTSTDSEFLRNICARYDIPMFVRDGLSGIKDDWNFAYQCADADLVTIAHQDDCYHKDYAMEVQQTWERYRDTTVFSTDCVVVKGHTLQQAPDVMAYVKHFLRLPLRLRGLAHLEAVKKAALMFGNPIICPSCTYDKRKLGEHLFQSDFKFALDWDELWRIAGRDGRFVCVEKPLIYYRVHDGATTKECIEDNTRVREETEMFRRIWPEWMVKILMRGYRQAYKEYGES